MDNKNRCNKIKLNTVTCIVLLACISLILSSIFLIFEDMAGHDMYYHLDTIRSLNEAWQNGTFGSRIYNLICQDYGYGTGLFYSMLPAGMVVILMNALSISARTALFIEFYFLFFLSSLVIYFFSKKVFKKNKIALICSSFYICYPYFFSNVYVRFALSECFIMLAFPLCCFGLYELIQNNNKRLFFILFTLGFSLAILTHLTLSIYIAIILFIFICLNFRKFFSNKKWLIFIISCAIILIISACYYVPLLINFNITQTSSLAYSTKFIYKTTLDTFSSYFLICSILISILIYIIFLIIRFKMTKTKRKTSKNLFIISTICLWTVTPLFPWIILEFLPFNMIQFAWRLLNLNAVCSSFMLGFIIKNINNSLIKKNFLRIIYCMCIIGLIVEFAPSKQQPNININQNISINSGLSYNYGLGSTKVGDYYPLGATNKYIFNRASSMILESNATVTEFANYQTINQMSFLMSPKDETLDSWYIVLNIPYSVCENLSITQYDATYNTYNYDISEDICDYEINGEYYLKIEIKQIEEEYEYKIVINYEDNGTFDKYFQENPFEFVVKSGEASFTNYIKTGTNYTVDISANGTSTIELPTLFYYGYTLTYTTASGAYELEPVLGENGFIEIEISESGTLSVVFEGTYVKVANTISIIGIILFVILIILSFAVPLIIKHKKNSNNQTKIEIKSRIDEEQKIDDINSSKNSNNKTKNGFDTATDEKIETINLNKDIDDTKQITKTKNQ